MGKKNVVFITGLSGSGKSTVAMRLKRSTGYALFQVGKFQREWARQHGYANAVEFNRNVGLEKAYFSLLPAMIEHIQQLIRRNNGVIVEGLYSKTLYQKIAKAFPRATMHVFNLTTGRHERAKRYAARENIPIPVARAAMRLLDRQKRKIGITDIQRMRGEKIHIIPNKGTLRKTMESVRSKLPRKRR